MIEFLYFLLCSSSRGAWFHDKSIDATPGDIKSFEVRSPLSFFFFAKPRVHHYLQYLSEGHHAVLVSATAIIRSMRLWTVLLVEL